MRCGGTTTSDTKFAAIALVYGPPEPWWVDGENNFFTVPLTFRIVLEKFFEPAEVARVGLRRMAHDYGQWYRSHEDHKR